MEKIGFKLFAILFGGMGSLLVSAQNDLTVKVTNLRTKPGKVLLATRTGQYAMEEVKGDTVVLKLAGVPEGDCTLMVFQDENENFQLDKETEVPIENCAMKQIVVTKGRNRTIVVVLEDLRNKIKKPDTLK